MTKRKLHIILIDDYPNGLDTFADLLRCWGYAVTPFSRGKEAIQMLGENSIDLVITNLTELPRIDALSSVRDSIPDMTNREVLERVKQKEPRLPVMVLASNGSDESAARALRSGVADYISKPFLLEELKSRIESVLGSGTR